jgi:homoserine dehydrogenase
MKKISIIGAGGIAKHLQSRLKAQGHHAWLTTRRNKEEFSGLLKSKQIQAVFIAISTLDKGEAARDYILASVKAGIPVITCEKGALAYHAEILKPHLDKIGFSATVGGGTRMLKYVAERHLAGKQAEIHAVVNGTLNFIFDEIRRGGRSLGEACKLGYAEPGASDPLSLINGELRDVRMKTCVFFNTVLAAQKLVTPDHFGSLEQTADDLERLSEEGGDHRLVVSFLNHKSTREYPRYGKQFGLHFIEGWHITGAFRQITQASQLSSWLPGGVGNAVHIIEGELGSGGKYTLSGPGAGHEPTTSAMLADFEELCK